MVRTMSRIWMCRQVMLASVLVVLSACGGHLPPPERGVLEDDVSEWKFRRYQELLDVEVWVEKNEAVAHTASYVRSDAEKSGSLADGDIVNAFVTRYEHDTGLVRAVVVFARRLVQQSGYRVEERERHGARLIAVHGPDEAWVLWPSARHVVKIGGRGVATVPGALIEAYAKRYPSRLEAGMLEGPLPEAPSGDDREPQRPYDPDNPTPDWDQYEQGSPGAASE